MDGVKLKPGWTIEELGLETVQISESVGGGQMRVYRFRVHMPEWKGMPHEGWIEISQGELEGADDPQRFLLYKVNREIGKLEREYKRETGL